MSIDHSRLVVYGADWCSDCARSKQFLDEQNIPYIYIDVEHDAAARQFVLDRNGGKQLIPTVVFPDGSILTEPSNGDLAAKLELDGADRPPSATRNVIIIGSGPSGYTAALYAARANLRPLVYAGYQHGGQLMLTSDVENYPGFSDGIMGPALMADMRAQAERFGAEMRDRDVTSVDFSQRPFTVVSEDETEYAEAVIVATGASAK